MLLCLFFFFQAEDGIRDHCVTGVQTCALPIWGTPALAERRGVDYIIKQLAKAGVPHALHEPELLISLPRRARLEVVAPEPRVLTAKTPSMSLSTDGRYKRGNLVYVPTGQAGAITAIFARVELAADVAGRVVLTEGYPSPGKVAALQDRGAQAAVFISPGERIHEGTCTTIWGSPDLDSRAGKT